MKRSSSFQVGPVYKGGPFAKASKGDACANKDSSAWQSRLAAARNAPSLERVLE